jgi:dTDP-4-dehydrorhamnose reductase
MSKKLLVIGGSGELGYQIIRNSDSWKTFSTYHSNNLELKNLKSFKLDIRNKNEVDRSIRNIAEEDDKKRAIVHGALNIARSCNKIGCRSVFISTDLVFDGGKGNYTESDTPNPLMSYGRYKAQMERELLGLDHDLVIVRTSLVITLEPMGHQVSWIVNSINHNIELNLFTDEYRSPIFALDLAKAILELAELDFKGIINVTGPEALNRYDLGKKIANYFKLDINLLKPVKAEQLDINRPLNCTLDSTLAKNMLDAHLKPISEIFI